MILDMFLDEPKNLTPWTDEVFGYKVKFSIKKAVENTLDLR